MAVNPTPLPSLTVGARAAAVSAAVSAAIAILAVFHVIAWSQPQNTAVVVAAVSLAGLLFYLAGVLHWYGTASFNVGQLTSAATAVVSAAFEVLTAFNIPAFSAAEQSTLLGSVGTLIALGVGLWSYLKTNQHKAIVAQLALSRRIKEINATKLGA